MSTLKERRLKYTLTHPEGCIQCGLFENANTYKFNSEVLYKGTSKKMVLLVVDRPTKWYDKTGEIYGDKAYQELKDLAKNYLPKLHVVMCFAARCYSEKLKISHLRQCSSYTQEDIDSYEPNAIILLGKDSQRMVDEMQGTVPCFSCGSIHDYVNKKIALTGIQETFIRVYKEVTNTLEPIPYTTNLSRIVMQSKKYNELAVDFEWNPVTGIPHSVGLAAGSVTGGFILDERVREVIRDAFTNKNMTLVGHNITADCRKILQFIGNNIECKFMDTLVLKRELAFNNKAGGLKHFAEKYLFLENYWHDITVDDFHKPSPKLLRYTAGDAWSTLMLWSRFYSDNQEAWDYMDVARKLDMDMILPVSYMIEGGIKLDLDILAKQRKELRSQQTTFINYFDTEYGINPDSPAQVLKVLQKSHKVESSGVEVLSKLDTEFSNKVLAHRKITKLLTTYLDKIPSMADDDNIIHCNLHIGGTVTGRMSSSNPNMQNIPPSVRGIFKSVFDTEGTLITVDASQSELRCLAYLSESEYLIKSYNEGKDMHTLVAELAGIERKNAKTLNFAYVYGSSEGGLIAQLIQAGVRKRDAKSITNKFMDTMESIGIMEYQQHLLDKAKKLGYIYSPYGRVGTRLNPTQIVNYPIQSFSADLNKLRIIYVFNELRKRKLISRIWLEFHDALELDVYKPEIDEVKKIISSIDTTIPDVLGKGRNLQLRLDVKEHGVNWE